eukprot:TRINITY_DN34501_c0_g1_i1.p1 TRINITY_DN34501_c0_g1~~TRINITY_DN34501_c0_g1_i1.p1  ORF type:complete len:280 (+),score=57.92 TRINITY_DN34501_c0_g1_i1:91-930(+)
MVGGSEQAKSETQAAACPREAPSCLDFAGKRAVVTGAGKGIGRAIAEALRHAGCKVCALSRTASDLASLEGVEGITVDLGDAAAVEKAMSDALELLGGIDYLVNNAGVALNAPLLETKLVDFETTMNVNARAALLCTQVAARRMIEDGVKGSIVNVSSQAGVVAMPRHTGYCMSKAAMDMLTKMTALELGPQGIRCNSVNPTAVMTDMGRTYWGDDEKAGPLLDRIPLQRFAELREVVEPVIFLLSSSAGMINGGSLPIEGGLISSCTCVNRTIGGGRT